MQPGEQARNPSGSQGKGTQWPDPCTPGLRRLAFTQAIKDPAFAIFVVCAIPGLFVAAPLLVLAALAFVLALWRVRYLDLIDVPPAHLCARCLYDTRGLAALVCPECGQPLQHSPPRVSA